MIIDVLTTNLPQTQTHEVKPMFTSTNHINFLICPFSNLMVDLSFNLLYFCEKILQKLLDSWENMNSLDKSCKS